VNTLSVPDKVFFVQTHANLMCFIVRVARCVCLILTAVTATWTVLMAKRSKTVVSNTSLNFDDKIN
jgi:hypothetical protein